MGWGVHDYPEPSRQWQLEHYADDDEYDEYKDEWENFYLDDVDIDEVYDADDDDLL